MRPILWCCSLLMAGAVNAAAQIPVRTFVEPGAVSGISLSPDGRHLAMIVPRDDHSDLVVLDRATRKPTANMAQKTGQYISDFTWVTDNRLIVSLARKNGALEQPQATGELIGLDADGKNNQYLFGYNGGASSVTRPSELAKGAGFLLEDTPDENGKILIAVANIGGGERGYLQFGRMNINNGSTVRAGVAPVRYFGGALTDSNRKLRFISGSDADRKQQLFYRAEVDGQWQLLNDARSSGRSISPMAYTPDGVSVYALVEEATGLGRVVKFNPVTGEEKVLLRGKQATPGSVVMNAAGSEAYAIRTFDGRGGYAFLDPKSMEAQLTQNVMQSFPGELAIANSFSRDGAYATVLVTSDVNPGEYFLYEHASKKLTSLIQVQHKLKPEQLASMEPFSFTSRDKKTIYGLLTKPINAKGKLPMLVLPHGGPYGVVDRWGYNPEVQIFASRGYAVLQVNFRGSGGYGEDFEMAGKREWGGTMQDDVTDATRWAIEQGVADPKRICIGGASYGAYAALMGVVREPDLYQCAIGYSGVYDLRLMDKKGDIKESASGRDFLKEMLSTDPAWMAERSPTLQAAKITQPILLLHGGKDVRTPPEHAWGLRDALTEAGNPPQWYFEENEAHGFYKTDHQQKAYEMMLAFLDKHIGDKAD